MAGSAGCWLCLEGKLSNQRKLMLVAGRWLHLAEQIHALTSFMVWLLARFILHGGFTRWFTVLGRRETSWRMLVFCRSLLLTTFLENIKALTSLDRFILRCLVSRMLTMLGWEMIKQRQLMRVAGRWLLVAEQIRASTSIML